MSDTATTRSILEEIDVRQDELLDRLDDLSRQIETVIAAWIGQREEETPSESSEGAVSKKTQREIAATG